MMIEKIMMIMIKLLMMIYYIFSFIATIRLTHCNRLQCTIMQLKQFTRTQMTEDINLNYTNRTDSLQYTALIAAYEACPPYGARTRYLTHSTPDVIQCATGPHHDDDGDDDDNDDDGDDDDNDDDDDDDDGQLRSRPLHLRCPYRVWTVQRGRRGPVR